MWGDTDIPWHQASWDRIISLAGWVRHSPMWGWLQPVFMSWLQVALLCGPPGLGKTTLAHVIARHAGYCVVEMNAR